MPLTILDETIFIKEVLHSKFIVSLRHVEGDGGFDEHLREVKEKYPKANHYCYGARLSSNEKMGDDGEPSHSAGLQILSALRYKKLEKVSIIVIRYFGGTKLGLPRLTRTYRECAEEAIQRSEILEEKNGLAITLKLPYSELDQLKYRLEKAGLKILNIEYNEDILVSFSGEEGDVDKLLGSVPEERIAFKTPTTIYKEAKP